MKKIFLSFVIILLVIGIVFIICINRKVNNKKKFTFWSIQLKPVYEKQITNIINEFENKYPDYKVVWVDIPIQEAQKRTLASILSSSVPDLINLNPDFSLILAQKNALEYFNDNEVKQYRENLVNKLKYNNKIYAIPFYATSPVTIYNKEIFKKCNIENIPKTYDDVFLISSKLKKCSSIPPFVSNLNENDTLNKIFAKYDITTFESENEKQEIINIYSKLNKMYKNNLFIEDILSLNHREIIEKYMSNQALIMVIGSNFINMIKQNAPDIYSKSALSNQLTGSNEKYDIALMNLVIPKKSKNKDIAKEFAFILTNEKNQLELAKLTNVLPANKYTLENDFFKNCSNDLSDLSRCIATTQLNNLIDNNFENKNKKLTNELINKTLEKILLDKNSSRLSIEKEVDILTKELLKIKK